MAREQAADVTVQISGLGSNGTDELSLVGGKFGQSEGSFGMLNLQMCHEKDCKSCIFSFILS